MYFCKSIRALTMFPSTRWLLLCLLDAIVMVIGLWRWRRAYEVMVVFVAFRLSSCGELSVSKNDAPATTWIYDIVDERKSRIYARVFNTAVCCLLPRKGVSERNGVG